MLVCLLQLTMLWLVPMPVVFFAVLSSLAVFCRSSRPVFDLRLISALHRYRPSFPLVCLAAQVFASIREFVIRPSFPKEQSGEGPATSALAFCAKR